MSREVRLGIGIVFGAVVVLGFGLLAFTRAVAPPSGSTVPAPDAEADEGSTADAPDTAPSAAEAADPSTAGTRRAETSPLDEPEWVRQLPKDTTPRSTEIAAWRQAREARQDGVPSMPTRGDQHPHAPIDGPQFVNRGYVGPGG